MNERPLQISLKSIMLTTLGAASLFLLLRTSGIAAAFLALTSPFCIAVWFRRKLLAARYIGAVPIRLPLFLTLFFMFYLGMLGPYSLLMFRVLKHIGDGPMYVATVAPLSPVLLACHTFPSLRVPCDAYLESWDRRWHH
ncbi:hypothetical protein RBSH_01564 [Rhodopirellula baltica SH28]|uniref:Uncharacterized protein n=1 Tax=Rhodopirellula baltica SH28 TaxID=993517 RepID=K5DJS8_RHOBT|nr:hypothetical protein RBSH_01564 [Rhodopirellula baltica SH28]